MSSNFPQPPILDNTLVEKLAELASHIDGLDASLAAEFVQDFNSLAGTEVPYQEFQGIYGGEEHVDYVRRLLIAKNTIPLSNLGQRELTQMFQRMLDNPSDVTYVTFALSAIEKTFGDPQVSDLIFWPGEYFRDGEDSRTLSAEQMAEAVLEKYHRRELR